MEKEQIKVQLAPAYINLFNRIMEGYEYLGVVSTLDSKRGVVLVRTTPDLYEAARDVVEHMPFEIFVLQE